VPGDLRATGFARLRDRSRRRAARPWGVSLR
jgi:hypothetical protein